MNDASETWRDEVVAVGALPAVDDAPFERLETKYLTQQRVIWSVVLAPLVIAATVVLVIVDAPIWVPAVVLAVGLLVLAVAWVLEGLAFDYRGVQLREHDVSTRRGLIGRTTISVPFTRVQHVTVERGALDRVFGLAQVVIFTAGAIAADARVKGLDPERAERLREGIINRSTLATRASGPDDAAPDGAEPPDTEPVPEVETAGDD